MKGILALVAGVCVGVCHVCVCHVCHVCVCVWKGMWEKVYVCVWKGVCEGKRGVCWVGLMGREVRYIMVTRVSCYQY